MIKLMAMVFCSMLLLACHTPNNAKPATEQVMSLTPTDVLAQSTDDEWRLLDAENTLYLTLESGVVIIELLPDLAPIHVKNTKALVRQGIFNNTNFYRVIDGFVAQGGPMYASEAEMKPLVEGSYSIPNELTFKGDLSDSYLAFDNNDGFADETGFVKSFAVGKDLSTGESWLLHCYGALGMGRANELDSGGTELYFVNGPAQRYLDRNVTVFGRVISGMEHIQALQRGSDLHGPIDLTGKNIITSIQVAADLPTNEVQPIEIMDTNSVSFKMLLQARKNRTGEWFVHQHNYMDACGVPIPVRLME
jgi:peptidylprolyl isomerase